MGLLKKIGLHCIPDSNLLRYGAWLGQFRTWKKQYLKDAPRFSSREELYRHLNGKVLQNGPISYLEFGVYKGSSIRAWSQVNTCPESRFVGFDTFRGLPETWDKGAEVMQAGTFDTGGQIPQIDDSRVSFIAGLFQDTLGGFLKNFSPAGTVVLHNDSDLYSATLYTLSLCNPVLPAGSIIIFDEFQCILHEYRAFEDWTAAFMRKFEVLGVTPNNTQVAVKLL
jgi:O-methyltransferase